MVEERRSKSRLGKILVVVSVLGLLVGFFLPPPWHPAPAIPTSPPDELYRVYLPSGWSIVRPPGWEVFLKEAPDGSHGSFEFGIWMVKASPYFRVEWSNEKPETTSTENEVLFQGRRAWLTTEYQPPSSSIFIGSDRRETNRIERHGCLRATLVTQRDDRWISIRYVYYGKSPTIPEMMWKYFETLRRPSSPIYEAGT